MDRSLCEGFRRRIGRDCHTSYLGTYSLATFAAAGTSMKWTRMPQSTYRVKVLFTLAISLSATLFVGTLLLQDEDARLHGPSVALSR